MWSITLFVVATLLHTAFTTCPEGYTLYTLGWCYREVTELKSYHEAIEYCKRDVQSGRLILPSRISSFDSGNSIYLSPGLHRTAGRWDRKKEYWFDGVTENFEWNTEITSWDPYISPYVCDATHPKRGSLVWDVTYDKLLAYDNDVKLPFICEASA